MWRWFLSWGSSTPTDATIVEYGSRTGPRNWRRRIPFGPEDFGLAAILTDENQPLLTNDDEPILAGHAPVLRVMSGPFLRTIAGVRLRVM
jgi:hypothetical protein